MRFAKKNQVILLGIIVFISCFGQSKVLASNEHCAQADQIAENILSPKIVCDSSKIMNSFIKLSRQMKRTTLYTPREDNLPKVSLTDRGGMVR
ncbi:MAG: hypothetical protein KJ915_03080 [Candidatus Omnitrophica bacterium]|nr:hypothetical protein [Candidatus Omnitrophota bacterium]